MQQCASPGGASGNKRHCCCLDALLMLSLLRDRTTKPSFMERWCILLYCWYTMRTKDLIVHLQPKY